MCKEERERKGKRKGKGFFRGNRSGAFVGFMNSLPIIPSHILRVTPGPHIGTRSPYICIHYICTVWYLGIYQVQKGIILSSVIMLVRSIQNILHYIYFFCSQNRLCFREKKSNFTVLVNKGGLSFFLSFNAWTLVLGVWLIVRDRPLVPPSQKAHLAKKGNKLYFKGINSPRGLVTATLFL